MNRLAVGAFHHRAASLCVLIFSGFDLGKSRYRAAWSAIVIPAPAVDVQRGLVKLPPGLGAHSHHPLKRAVATIEQLVLTVMPYFPHPL